MIAVILSAIALLFGIALGRALEHGDTKAWMKLTIALERQLEQCRKELWFYTKR